MAPVLVQPPDWPGLGNVCGGCPAGDSLRRSQPIASPAVGWDPYNNFIYSTHLHLVNFMDQNILGDEGPLGARQNPEKVAASLARSHTPVPGMHSQWWAHDGSCQGEYTTPGAGTD